MAGVSNFAPFETSLILTTIFSPDLSPTTVVVHYFEGHGLAERSVSYSRMNTPLSLYPSFFQRWMLAAGGITFKNSPVASRAAFLKLRDEDQVLPFGQLPLLEIDGLKLSQSLPCAMYVARKAGFVPSDPKELVQMEMVRRAMHNCLPREAARHICR